jgi:N-acetylneuraminate synthase/N,N'-diacetyllegionaminate synthase
MEIGSISVTDGVYFIAEAGVNHNGDLEMARELIDVAAEADADAIKFQTFSADRLVTKSAPTADYQDNEGASQYDMLEQYELNRADHEELQTYCEKRGVTFLSTPFDKESLHLLDELDVPAIKFGSGELTNLPLLREAAKLGRPLIISTGMSTMTEVEAAYDCVTGVGSPPDVALLHCVSAYPTPLHDVNLRAMQAMDERFSAPIGFSDHTTEVETPAVAVGAGAKIMEKHVTLDRSLPGPDHEASLEPGELTKCVTITRNAASAMGTEAKRPVESESENRSVVRKSLHATRQLEPGTNLMSEDVQIVRPADGLAPEMLSEVLGRTIRRPSRAGDALRETHFKKR